MTDRELLELAAKAAGVPGTYWTNKEKFAVPTNGEEAIRDGYIDWNPLTDDGDALRLAVRLKLFSSEIINDNITLAIWESDPYVATRHAIVRTAAEIGRTLP